MLIFQTKVLRLPSDSSPVSFSVAKYVWPDGKVEKVWWCNTLWGWMLHTLFLSLQPLRPSMRLLFLFSSLLYCSCVCKHWQSRNRASQIFDKIFIFFTDGVCNVCYLIRKVSLMRSLLSVKSEPAWKEIVDEVLWKGIKLCNKNYFGVDLANSPRTSVFY